VRDLYDEYHTKESGIGASQQCISVMCLSVAPLQMLNIYARHSKSINSGGRFADGCQQVATARTCLMLRCGSLPVMTHGSYGQLG
jgi:hypothetical protein